MIVILSSQYLHLAAPSLFKLELRQLYLCSDSALFVNCNQQTLLPHKFIVARFGIMDKYEFVKDIGAGSFGSAKLMMNKETKQLVAVKFIKRGPEINENVVREIINHRSTMHPNIVRFIELLLTPTHLLIVMEYAAGGELYDRVRNAGRFSEDEARYFFQQLISGVSYCHSMIQSLEKVTAAPSRALKPTTMIFLQRLRYLVNLLAKQISHGDLKLANTLLDGSPAPRLKICDFGYSVSSVLHSKPKSIAGTLQYVAPEVLSGTEYDGKLADVWSCGVTLYVMLVGAYPFEDEKDPKKIEKTTQCILGARYEIPAYIHISEECRHLLSHMFVAPARRITIQEIKNHPWFLKNLPREPTAAAQAMYYSKTNPTFLIQTLDEIMEIVDEAKKPATCPPFDSNLIGGFRWAKEESDNDQEENVDLEMGEEEVKEEDEYEVSKENGYDKKVEVCEDKRVKEFCKLKSLSVSDAVRSAERSQVLNQFHSDHTDPSPVAATSVDQSMFGLRLPERSLGTNQMHSYHSDSAVSQSVAYAKKGKNSNQMDSSMYVRLAERSIESNALHFHHSHPSASQSISFAGNPRNSKLSYSSICNVRSSEKSIKSNVSHPSEPSESQMQSPDSASELSDTKSWEKVASFDPSMSDVREAEKSIVLKQLHSYQNSSASKLCAPCLPEGSIDSIVLDSDYSAQIGNLDLSISDVRSAEKSIVSSFHFDWRG